MWHVRCTSEAQNSKFCELQSSKRLTLHADACFSRTKLPITEASRFFSREKMPSFYPCTRTKGGSSRRMNLLVGSLKCTDITSGCESPGTTSGTMSADSRRHNTCPLTSFMSIALGTIDSETHRHCGGFLAHIWMVAVFKSTHTQS